MEVVSILPISVNKKTPSLDGCCNHAAAGERPGRALKGTCLPMRLCGGTQGAPERALTHTRTAAHSATPLRLG
jgi:hypothetical protein